MGTVKGTVPTTYGGTMTDTNTGKARPSATDMRLPGESFCADCPDHEACASGYPCDFVRRVDIEARARRAEASR